jgi:SAM-dependent methyltransferase
VSEARRPPSWNQHNASAFQLDDVVAHYHLRAPYPSTLIAFLLGLVAPPGGRVLELGCGTGEIARAIAPHAERVDAVDVSARMIKRGRELAGGEHAAIRWIEGPAEAAAFTGPYSLAVAGLSLHWMDWEMVLPRIAQHLAPAALLAIVSGRDATPPWGEELLTIIRRYSTIRNWQTTDLIALLEQGRLFTRIGEKKLNPESYGRTVDEYIDAQHATSGLARERMGRERALEFDDAVRALVSPYVSNGLLTLSATAEVTWGTPLAA